MPCWLVGLCKICLWIALYTIVGIQMRVLPPKRRMVMMACFSVARAGMNDCRSEQADRLSPEAYLRRNVYHVVDSSILLATHHCT